MGEGPTERGLKGRGGSRPAVPPPFRSMRATDGSRRQGRECGRWVSVFMSLWATATSCSTGLMGYIFATFNKLTCCIIIHVYIYLCLSQKSWVFHGMQGHTPSTAHDRTAQRERRERTSTAVGCMFIHSRGCVFAIVRCGRGSDNNTYVALFSVPSIHRPFMVHRTQRATSPSATIVGATGNK